MDFRKPENYFGKKAKMHVLNARDFFDNIGYNVFWSDFFWQRQKSASLLRFWYCEVTLLDQTYSLCVRHMSSRAYSVLPELFGLHNVTLTDDYIGQF